MTTAETLQKLAERRLQADPNDVLGQFFADASDRARQREPQWGIQRGLSFEKEEE